ncbi:hypothetical protein [Escherichia coli]|uniref:hypothetical protein n=1 Tax=Escherichia coli TaxID=562 RepID=UPI0029C22AE8|nr:hypothetical protein [Escherichia coli]MDX5555965.1 hypothetical protein [Escherichia coli]
MSHLDLERGLYEGMAAGQSRGYEQGSSEGYAVGHRDGWNEAVRTMTPQLQALEQERDALKRDRLDLQYAANAFAVISRTMKAIIESAPADMQVDAIHRYNELCDRYLTNGVLRTEPHNDPTAKERDSEVTGFFPKLAQQLNARSSADYDPSP